MLVHMPAHTIESESAYVRSPSANLRYIVATWSLMMNYKTLYGILPISIGEQMTNIRKTMKTTEL